MDHREIEERGLVELYLAGRLDAADEERFEEHYLSCAECLEQLELSQAFRDGLRHAAAEDALRAATAQRLGLAARFARAVRSPRAGALLAAAAVVLAVALGLTLARLGSLGERNADLASQLADARAPQANTPLLALSPERGGAGTGEAPAARLTRPAEPGWVVLSLELGDATRPAYRATLTGPDDVPVWHGDDLHPDGRDALTVSLYTGALADGDHEVRVDGRNADGTWTAVSRFAFRVQPPRP
jgi:hypothetical protein